MGEMRREEGGFKLKGRRAEGRQDGRARLWKNAPRDKLALIYRRSIN